MTKIKNSVIWITGASSGIGEQLTYQLSAQGAKLILSARRQNELLKVADNCQVDSQDQIKILPLDLEHSYLLKLSVEAAINLFGRIDVLINNGGISQRSLAKETSVEVYRKLMEVNYFGSLALSQHLLSHFLERKNGHFVVVSSVVGKIGVPYRSGYAASKHALHGYFDSLRAEHYKDNIKVSLICPGWVNTSLSQNALKGDGTALGKKDRTHSKGVKPEYCARKIVHAIKKEKSEIWLGGREKMAVYVKRFFPALFRMIIRKAKVN